MNKNHLLTALLTLAVAMPSLADIRIAFPSAAAPGSSLQGNCELFASNTVRATYQGQHDMVVPAPSEFDAVVTARVAVFEVVENLAYQRFVRYGDGRLQPGTRFTVTLNRKLPGQPAAVVDTIEQMQQGDEAVMRIDHLYMMGDPTGYPVRACSRMALRKAPAAPAPQQPADAAQQSDPSVPTTVAPLSGPAPQVNSSFNGQAVSVSMNGNGAMQTVRTVSHYDSATGQMVTRMYINGVEVDPQTHKPLQQAPAAQQPAAPAAQPTPAPADPAAEPAPVQPVEPAPADTHPAEGDSDDTIIEHTPEAPAAPAPAPAPAEEEGF